MGVRFYRRIKLIPGLRLTVSKSGISTSIGGRGHWLTFGKRGTRATVGIPGTGLSYTHIDGVHQAHQEGQGEAQPATDQDVLLKGRAWRGWMRIAALLALIAASTWGIHQGR